MYIVIAQISSSYNIDVKLKTLHEKERLRQDTHLAIVFNSLTFIKIYFINNTVHMLPVILFDTNIPLPLI